MLNLFDLTRWPTLLIFMLAGAAGTLFALITVNLFSQAVASLGFLREFGLEAVYHGALWQVAELLGWGSLALLCWIVFKISERALEDRYWRWTRGRRRKRAPEADSAAPAQPDRSASS